MLSKAKIRLIQSLQYKKFRKSHALFVVEGIKSISEFIDSGWEIDSFFLTENAFAKMRNLPQKIKLSVVSESEIKKVSFLQNPQGAVAVFKMQDQEETESTALDKEFVLALDQIQDPGNLGTIIRTAEWFGMHHIFCSEDSADAFNPKVVQASMGSLARVKVHYVDLKDFIDRRKSPVYGALLEGNSIYETSFQQPGIILMGNEGSGIRGTLMEKINHPVTIPNFGHAESLNVAIATTVFCSEIARRRGE